MFGLTRVRNDKDFVVHISHKKIFFSQINFQVFLKHPPGHEKSISILGNKIRPCYGHEKSRYTYKHTYGHPQIFIWISYGHVRICKLYIKREVTSAQYYLIINNAVQ